MNKKLIPLIRLISNQIMNVGTNSSHVGEYSHKVSGNNYVVKQAKFV